MLRNFTEYSSNSRQAQYQLVKHIEIFSTDVTLSKDVASCESMSLPQTSFCSPLPEQRHLQLTHFFVVRMPKTLVA